MNRDAVERALLDAGTATIEPVGPRLAVLEQRVMAHTTATPADERTRPVVVPLTSARRTALRRISVGAVAACIVALLALSLTWFGNDDSRLVVAAADEVELVLPDGSVVDAAPGRELPTGTRINVGGSLVVDGVSYGPGMYEVTDRGVVAVDVVVVSTTTTTAPGRDRPASSTVPVLPEPRPSAPATGTSVRPATSIARDGVGDGTPASTRPPRDSADTRPSTTASEPAPTRPVDTRPDSSLAPTTTQPRGDRSDTTVATRPTTTVAARPTTTREQRPTTAVGDRPPDR